MKRENLSDLILSKRLWYAQWNLKLFGEKSTLIYPHQFEYGIKTCFTTYNPNKNSSKVNAYAAMCYNVQSIRACNFIQKYVNHDISQYLVLNIQITAVYYVLKIHSILISSHNLKELKHDSLKSNRVLSE